MAADVVEGRIRQIATEYAALVSREFKSCEIYLFGSHANGTFTDDSDIDIAVVGDEFLVNPVMDMFHLMRLRRKIDTRIEPHPFLRKDFVDSNPYVDEILTTGIRIL